MALEWPFECFTLYIYKKNLNILNFFNKTLAHFWNNSSQISSINEYSNVINGSKIIKVCKFCLKILSRKRREMAKKLWFWRNIIYKLFEKNKNTWYYKIIFSSTIPILSLELSFMSDKDRVNFYIFTIALLLYVRWRSAL